jgi:hypothetical protein
MGILPNDDRNPGIARQEGIGGAEERFGEIAVTGRTIVIIIASMRDIISDAKLLHRIDERFVQG